MAYFDRNPVGRLMTRTVNDVETLNELFSTGVVGLLGDLFTVVGIAVVMLWLDWQLGLVCLAAFPAILYLSRFYRRRAREVYRESRLILARLNAELQENIAGGGTIQAFGQELKMYGRFQKINYGYRDVLLRSVRYNAVFFPIIEIFSALTIGLLLWYGGGLILQQAIQAGVIVAFIQYIQRMYQPIRDLAEKYNIAVVSLYPGLVRTESVLRAAEFFDMSNSESPQFTGRVIAALANDPNVMSRTGKVWVVAALAEEYGIQDVDGKQPRPVTLEEA